MAPELPTLHAESVEAISTSDFKTLSSARGLRLCIVTLGVAAVVCGAASFTGGWLGVPSHQPAVVSYGQDAPEVERNRGQPPKSVSPLGWPLPWYERTEERFVDFDAYMTRGRASAIPALYVTTTIGPRPGGAWISGGVVGAGLTLAAFGARPRRRERSV